MQHHIKLKDEALTIEELGKLEKVLSEKFPQYSITDRTGSPVLVLQDMPLADVAETIALLKDNGFPNAVDPNARTGRRKTA